jgi:hypothetical protein
MNPHSPAREIAVGADAAPAYSICSLVTDFEEYQRMIDSFVGAGFGPGDCEFLYIDNTAGNKDDAYAGYNKFLNAARGRRIILCHQDILLLYDRREDLERRMAELEMLDPAWALLGNAGGGEAGVAAGRITHPDGEWNAGTPTPFCALSLDENFILVKREANLALSRDLCGFHFYGTDLCAIARILGWTAWVVDFHLCHKSTGSYNPAFQEMKEKTARKYRRALKGRFVQTTCDVVILGGWLPKRWLWAWWGRHLAFERIYHARREGRDKQQANAQQTAGLGQMGKGSYAAHYLARLIIRPWQNLNHAVRKRLISPRHGLRR